MLEQLKYLFVELRLNLLEFKNQNDRQMFKDYCEISIKAISEILTPEKIESILIDNLYDKVLIYEESYYSSDLNIPRDLDYYVVSNFLYSYSANILYHYYLLKRIINKLDSMSLESLELSNFDSKNTLNEKLLLIHYLVTHKKMNLNLLSQDTTKQAKILSFLFDNGAESLRKKLPLIEKSKSKDLKSKNNLNKIKSLIDGLSLEYESIKVEIINDLK